MVNSMQAITTYASAYLETLRRRLDRPAAQKKLKTVASAAAGFLLSAASLANRAVPLSLGLLCAAPPGIYAAAVALGGCIGYTLFWGEAQCLAWMGAGFLAVSAAGKSPPDRQHSLLLPALAAVVASGCGLAFLLLLGDSTPVGIYLLRVAVSCGSTACFRFWRSQPKGPAGWLVCGLSTLALAQIAPAKYLGLGYLACGFACTRLPLPMAVLAGLGVDLAGVTPIPMTAVMCLGFLPRMLPGHRKWLPGLYPALAYWLVIVLLGRWDPLPLPGLFLGGIGGVLFPAQPLPPGTLSRKGPSGLARTRLEQAADALLALEHSLLLAREGEIDLRALLQRAFGESCDTCPERKGCKARRTLAVLPPEILIRPGLQASDLPSGCKKPQRLLGQLRREQAALRAIKADRARQRSYRSALADQYRFVSAYLRTLSGSLCAAHPRKKPRFRPEIGVSTCTLETTGGDRWMRLSPVEDTCFFLLCDGMGTGEGAARDAEEAMDLICRLLQAGFSPEQALQCFNSISALGFSGGSATVDLVQLDLCSAAVTLYKWGAGASYLLHSGQLKKIGTAGPPPGLSQQARHGEYRLSLGGEDVLILLSDGAGAEGLARPQWDLANPAAGELAASILANGVHREDDATVAVIRLIALCPDTP